MNKIMNFLIKASSFNLYKRTLALVLAFVMLFNLSSEIFASTLQARADIAKMEDLSSDIKNSLNEEVARKEKSQEIKSCNSVESCYEKALQEYVMAAQDYSDLAAVVTSFFNMYGFTVSSQKATNKKQQELNAKAEQYIADVTDHNAEVNRLNEGVSGYAEYAMMVEKDIQEKRALDYLANAKDKRSRELYEVIKENNIETQKYLKSAGEWEEYERDISCIEDQSKELDARKQELLDEQEVIKKENHTNKIERAGIYKYNNDEMTRIFGDEGKDYLLNFKDILVKKNDESGEYEDKFEDPDVDKYREVVSKRLALLYSIYEEKKAAYDKAYKAYLELSLKEYKKKIEKLSTRLKAKCDAARETYDTDSEYYETRVKGGAAPYKVFAWNLFNREREMYNACISPLVTISDFPAEDSGELTHTDFIEIKYNEYKEEYLGGTGTIKVGNTTKCNTAWGWKEQKGETGSLVCRWQPDQDKIAQEKAAKVMGLMLLSGTLGTQALVSMLQEKRQADLLITSRGQEQEIVDYDIEESDFELENNIEYQKWYQEWKKEFENRKIKAEDYLKGVDAETEDKHNNIFKIVKNINSKAKEKLDKMYGPVMAKVARGERLDSIARSIGLDPNYLKKIAEEAIASQDADSAQLIRKEIANSGRTYSDAYIDAIITAKEEDKKNNRSRGEKIKDGVKVGFDIAFFWWPTTIPSHFNDKAQAKKEHNNAVRAYRTETNDILKSLLHNYAMYINDPAGTTYWDQTAAAIAQNKADETLRYMWSLASSMGLNGDGTEIRMKYQNKVQQYINKRQVEDFNTISLVLFLADVLLILGCGSVEMPSLISRFASISRNLRFLSLDQRIMRIALNNVIRRMNPATLTKYQRALETMRKFNKIPLQKGKELQEYLQASKVLSKVDKQVFQEGLTIAKKGNMFGKQTKKYQEAAKVFEGLLKDQKQVAAYLKELKAASKAGNPILADMRILEELSELTRNPALAEYNKAVAAYNDSFAIALEAPIKAGEGTPATYIVQTRPAKAPKKTRDIVALEKRIIQLSSKANKISPKTKRFLNIQEKAATSSKRIGNYYERWEKANRLAVEGKPKKVAKAKTSKKTKIKTDPNEIHSYKAPDEASAIGSLNARLASETSAKPHKFTFWEDLQIRLALSDTWNSLREGTVGFFKLFKTPKYIIGGVLPATTIGVEAPLLTSRSVGEVMMVTESMRALPMSVETFHTVSPIVTNGVGGVRTSPVMFKGVNPGAANVLSTGVRTLPVSPFGVANSLFNFNGFEGYDTRWNLLGLSRKKQKGVVNLNVAWWNQATTQAYFKDMNALQEKVLFRYQQEALELISQGKALPAEANITMQKVYKDISERINTNMLWWIYGDEVEDVLSNFKRHIPATTGRVAAVSFIPYIPEEIMGYLTGRAAVGLTYKELQAVKEAVIEAFKATGEKYVADFKGAQERINNATAMGDDNFVNILKAKIAEKINELEIAENYASDIITMLNARIDRMKNGEAIAVRRAVYNSTKEAMYLYVSKHGQQALDLIEQDANLKDPKFVELFMIRLQVNLAKSSLSQNRQEDYFNSFAQRLGYMADEKSKWTITRDMLKLKKASAVYGASIDGRAYAGNVVLIKYRGLVLGLMISPAANIGQKIDLLRDSKKISSGQVVNYSKETGIAVVLIDNAKGLSTYTLATEYPLPGQVLYMNGNSYKDGNSYVSARKFNNIDVVNQKGYLNLQGITPEDQIGAGVIDELGNLYGLALANNAVDFNTIRPLLTKSVANIFNNTQFREQAVAVFPEFANTYQNILAEIDRQYQARKNVFEKEIDIFGHYPNVESVFGPYKIQTRHFASAYNNTIKISPDLQRHMHLEMDIMASQVLRETQPEGTSSVAQVNQEGTSQVSVMSKLVTKLKNIANIVVSKFMENLFGEATTPQDNTKKINKKLDEIYNKLFKRKGSNRLYSGISPIFTYIVDKIIVVMSDIKERIPEMKKAFKNAKKQTLYEVKERNLYQDDAEKVFLESFRQELLAAGFNQEQVDEIFRVIGYYSDKRIHNPINANRDPKTDYMEIYDAIPDSFRKASGYYRGMRLRSLEEVEAVLKEGLPISKTHHFGVYFASEIRQAFGYAYNQQDTSAISMMLTYPNYSGLVMNGWGIDYTSRKDIPAEDLGMVIIWTTIGGREGWYKATLENDKLVLEFLSGRKQEEDAFDEININTTADYDQSLVVYADQLKLYYDEEKEFWAYMRRTNQDVENSSENAQAFYVTGINMFEQKKYLEAIDAFDEVLKYDREFNLAYYYRAQAKFYLGELDGALADINRVISFGIPVESNAYYMRGIIKQQKQDYQGAKEDFEKAIESLNRSDDNYSLLKKIYTNAIAQVQEEAAMSPGEKAYKYFTQASKFFERGEYTKALDAVNKALSFNANSAESYRLRFEIRAILEENNPEIINDINQAILLNGNDPLYYMVRAKFKAKTDYAGALEDFDKTRTDHTTADYFYNRALFRWYNLNDKQGAVADLKLAKRAKPDIHYGDYYIKKSAELLSEWSYELSKIEDETSAFKKMIDNVKAKFFKKDSSDKLYMSFLALSTFAVFKLIGLVKDLKNRVPDIKKAFKNAQDKAVKEMNEKALLESEADVLFLKLFEEELLAAKFEQEKVREIVHSVRQYMRDELYIQGTSQQVIAAENQTLPEEVRNANAENLIKKAKAEVENKNFEDAFNYYNQAVDIAKDNPKYYYERAMFELAFLKDKTAGLKDLRQANLLAPNEAKYYYYLAEIISLDENGAEEALNNYNKAIELDSTNPFYYESRAHLKYWHFDKEDALTDLKTALKYASTNANDLTAFRLSYTINYWTKDLLGKQQEAASAAFKDNLKSVYNKTFGKKRHGKLFLSIFPITTSLIMQVSEWVKDVKGGVPALKKAFKNAEKRTLAVTTTTDNEQAKDLFLGYFEEELALAKIDAAKAEQIYNTVDNYLQEVLNTSEVTNSAAVLADTDVNKPISKKKQNVKPYDYMTNMEVVATDPKGVIDELTDLLNIMPNDDIAYFYRAKAKAELKDYYGAIADMEKAIQNNPTNAQYYHECAWLKRIVRNYIGAEQDLNKAIELDANKSIYFYDRAVLRHYYTNNLEGAVADYQQAIDLKQSSKADEVSASQLYELSLEDAKDMLEEQKANGEDNVRIQDITINNFLEQLYAQIPDNITPEQENAINAMRSKVEDLRREDSITKVIDTITLYREALSLILMDKPVLAIHGAATRDAIDDYPMGGFIQADDKNVAHVSVNSDMRTNPEISGHLLPDFQDRLAFYISNLANSHQEFSIVINMHGSIGGAILMEDKTNLSTVLKIIKDNAGASKVNIVTTSCHGQAGDSEFIQQVIDYGFNYLGVTARNDVFTSPDIKNIFNYDLPTAFVNSIMLGYYGAILIYNGKIYRALEAVKEHYKDNPEKLREIELLQEYYFGKDPLKAMLELGKLNDYDMRLFTSEQGYRAVTNVQAVQLSNEEIEAIVLQDNQENLHVVNRTSYLGYPFAMPVGGNILTLTQPTVRTRADIVRSAKETLKEDEIQIVNEDLVTHRGNIERVPSSIIDNLSASKYLGIENIISNVMSLTMSSDVINPHAPKYTEIWESFATMHPNDALRAITKIHVKKFAVKDKYGKLPIEYALQNQHKVGINPQNNVFTYVYMSSVQAGINANTIIDEEKGLTLAMLTLMTEDNYFPFSFLQRELDFNQLDKEGNTLFKYIIEGVTPLETLKAFFYDLTDDEATRLLNIKNIKGEGVLQYVDNANLSAEEKLTIIKFLREKGYHFDASDENLVASLRTRELKNYATEMVKQTKAEDEYSSYVSKAEQEFANPTEEQAVSSKEGRKVSMSVLSYVDEKLAAKFIAQVKDINEINGEGFTALMYAAKNPNVKVVNLVLKNGGRANIQTKAGRALLIAQAANNTEVIKILEKKDKIFKQEQKAAKANAQEILDFDPDKTAFLGQKNLLPKRKDLTGLFVSLENTGDLIAPLERVENLRYLPTDSELKVKEEKALGEVYDDILKNPFKDDSHKVMAVLQGNGGRLFILNHGIALKDATTGKLAEDIHPDIRRHYGLIRTVHNHIPGVNPITKKDIMLLPTIVRSNPFIENDKFIVFHTPQADGTVLVTTFAKVNEDEAILISMRKISKEDAAKDSIAREELNSKDKGNNSPSEKQNNVEEKGNAVTNAAPATVVTEQAPVVQERYVSPLAAFLPESDYYIDDTLLKQDVVNFAESGKEIRGLKTSPNLTSVTNKDKAYFNPNDFYGRDTFTGEYPIENPQDFTVLVVQDDLNVFSRTVASLKKKGFNVLEAKDGEQAVSILNGTRKGGKKIHFVFIDTFVSYVNGYKIAEKITNEGFDTITILSSGMDDKVKHYRQGFDFQLSASGNDMTNSGNYVSYLIQKYGFTSETSTPAPATTVTPATSKTSAVSETVTTQNVVPVAVSSQAPASTSVAKPIENKTDVNSSTQSAPTERYVSPFASFLPEHPYYVDETELQRSVNNYAAMADEYVRYHVRTAPVENAQTNKQRSYFNEGDFFGKKAFEGEYSVENPGDYTVLIVQDDKDLLKAAERALKDKGFYVIALETGDAAFDLVRSFKKQGKPIHFVLLDSFFVTGKNGYDVANEFFNLGMDSIIISFSQGTSGERNRYMKGFDFSFSTTTNDLKKTGDFISYLIQKYGFKGTPKEKPTTPAATTGADNTIGSINTFYLDQNQNQNLAAPIEISQLQEEANFTTEIKEDQNPLLFLDTPTDTPASLATFFAFLPFIVSRKIRPSKVSKARKNKKSPTHLPLYYADDIQSPNLIPLNFTFQVDPNLKVNPKYDKVIFDKKGVAFYSGEEGTKVISNWYMKVPSKPYDLKNLIRAIRSVRLATPFEIKFTFANFDNTEFQRVLIYNSQHNVMNINALFPVGFLNENEGVMYSNGVFYTFDKKTLNKIREIKDFDLRVPKHQISNLTEIFNNSKIRPTIVLVPNFNKASVVYRDAMLSNISVGKTFGAIVKKELHVSGVVANGILFSIQYIIPLLSVFIKPIVKRLGEKKTLVLALSLSIAAGIMACAAGFYGIVPTVERTVLQKGIFLTAFVFMSLSTLLRQLVSTILIGDNAGMIKDTDPRASKYVEISTDNENISANPEDLSFKKGEETFGEYIKRMNRQIFGAPKDIYSVPVELILSKAFVFKSIGTLAFLALPYLINQIVSWITLGNVLLNLDYSASFPLLAAFSIYAAVRTLNANLRDRTATLSKQERQKAKKERQKARKERQQRFKENAKEYGFFNLVNQMVKDKIADIKKKTEFKKQLVKMKLSRENLGNFYNENSKILRYFAALSFANAHEIVISSALAAQLSLVFTNSATSNFYTALGLYAPLLLGRWLFSVVRGKASRPSSAVAFMALSLLGTLIMLLTPTSTPLLITGAAIASLGMGNCFTLLYTYIISQYSKEKEISISTAGSLSVVPGAILAMLSPYLIDKGYFQGSMLYAFALIIAVVIFSLPAMEGAKLLDKIRGALGIGTTTEDSTPKTERKNPFEDIGKWWHTPKNGPDMNNPEPQN